MDCLFVRARLMILVAVVLAANVAQGQNSAEPVSDDEAPTQIVTLESVDSVRGVVTVRGQQFRISEGQWVPSDIELQPAGSAPRDWPRWLSAGAEVGVVIENGEIVRIFPWEDEK